MINFGKIKKACLIGAGGTLVHFAEALVNMGVDVTVVIAPRHSGTRLPLTNEAMEAAFDRLEIEWVCVPDVNDDAFVSTFLVNRQFDIGICFGPAWIFSQKVIDTFAGRFLNFNGIPVPRYLGGAHYTWQILNADLSAGLAMQLITSEIDRGDVIHHEEHKLPDECRIPEDYFRENLKLFEEFTVRFLDKLARQQGFETTAYDDIEANRLYFPRLMTAKQAFVDWSMTGSDIERFCCAFDSPYSGAQSFLFEDEQVHLKSVKLVDCKEQFHPFCYGLIVRKNAENIYVAVEGGLLWVKNVLDNNQKDLVPTLREGQRFHTPWKFLEQAKRYRPIFRAKA